MIYARTIRTLAGPVKVAIEETPTGYSYSYSVKTARGGDLHRSVHLDGALLHSARDNVGYLRWVEETALADLGRELTREIQ